uniref:Chlorophyll a-b binding protein, chloroplastic n=1 Tax=Haptolina ericina TaxID=156174 RepID=A0A6T8ZB96_9EUKA|mmetsp:Transcript_10787/g.24825  ORF Transcript_10787/g.24825 Transcript_10787/m.24825 type:complete len:114 (+) Transcript_10787:578-919(+)
MVVADSQVSATNRQVFQLLNDPDAAPPGDFKFDPLGFSATGSSEMKRDMAEKELANGRIAMLAFSGIVTQSALTGGGFPYTYNGVADLVPPLAVVNPIDAIGICSSGIINGCQ